MTVRDRRALALFAGFLVLFFRETWLTARAYFARDITYFFHPFYQFTVENLQAGSLPLWNPHVAAGVPWLAEPQTAAFYPGSLCFFLFPFAAGFKLFHALHFFLTGLGAYLLVRRLGGTAGLALAGALLWTFNGFWLSRLEFPSIIGTGVWLPYLGLALISGRALFLAPALALCLLGGHWPDFLWTLAPAALWALSLRGPVRAVRLLAAGGALAAALAALQLAPTLAALARSERVTQGFDLAVAGLHGLTARNLLGLFFPWFSAMPEAAYPGEKFYWLGSFHLGVAGAALAGLALACLRRRDKLLWGGLFLFGALLSMGSHGPLFGFLHEHAVIFRWLRYPGQYTVLMIYAALGPLALAARPLSRRFPAALAALTLLLAAELFAYGHRRFPTLPQAFFRQAAGWVRPMQGSGGAKFFLSPKASGLTQGYGATEWDRWLDLRSRFFILTFLPYHVNNLTLYGFPLQPDATARFVRDLMAAPDFAAAAAALNRAGVRWIAAPAPIRHPALSLVAARPWFLYENKDAYPAAFLEAPGRPPAAWERIPAGPGRAVFSGAAAEAGTLKISEAWDPDWRAWADGRPVLSAPDGPFRSVRLSAGAGPVRFLYRPAAFRVGLAVALLGLVTICILSGRRLAAAALARGPFPA